MDINFLIAMAFFTLLTGLFWGVIIYHLYIKSQLKKGRIPPFIRSYLATFKIKGEYRNKGGD